MVVRQSSVEEGYENNSTGASQSPHHDEVNTEIEHITYYMITLHLLYTIA